MLFAREWKINMFSICKIDESGTFIDLLRSFFFFWFSAAWKTNNDGNIRCRTKINWCFDENTKNAFESKSCSCFDRPLIFIIDLSNCRLGELKKKSFENKRNKQTELSIISSKISQMEFVDLKRYSNELEIEPHKILIIFSKLCRLSKKID